MLGRDRAAGPTSDSLGGPRHLVFVVDIFHKHAPLLSLVDRPQQVSLLKLP